jgi:hypothetical protein
MLTLLPKQNILTFLIEDIFHLPLVSTTPVVHLELRKNSKRPLWDTQGLGGILFMKKT